MQEDMNALIRQIATLISAMQRREESLRELLNTELARLHRAVDGVDGRIGRAVEAVPRTIADRAQPAVDGIARALDERLGRSYRQFADAADRCIAALERKVFVLHKRMTRMNWGMAGLSALLLASVAYFTYANRHLVEETRRLRQEAQWLERGNHADLVPCGDKQLCANVDMNAKPIGDQRQYRPVKPRP